MADLETRLRGLGARIDFPPTPDVAAAVRPRLDASGTRTARRRRRIAAIAFAAAVLAVVGVLAVPQARTAVLDWLGLGGVQIVRVGELPDLAPARPLELGEPVTLREARRRFRPSRLVEPGTLGVPDEVYFRSEPPGGQVAYLYGSRSSVRLVLTQFRGDSHPLVRKIVDAATRVERISIDGARGYWIEGAHFVAYVDERGNVRADTLAPARNVLLWQRGRLTLRLEGALTKSQALLLARRVA